MNVNIIILLKYFIIIRYMAFKETLMLESPRIQKIRNLVDGTTLALDLVVAIYFI